MNLPSALRSLSLTQMNLTDDAFFQLPVLLSAPTKLQALILKGNQIRVEGAMALAQGLIDNITLKLLDLSMN